MLLQLIRLLRHAGLQLGQAQRYILPSQSTELVSFVSLGLLIATDAIHKAHYATNSILPKPSIVSRHVEGEEADDRLRARSLHFTNRGRNLVVSYLNHGVVCATVINFFSYSHLYGRCWDVAASAQLWYIEPNHAHRHM